MLARSAVLFLLLVRIAQADAIDYRVHYAATSPELVTVALRPAAPVWSWALRSFQPWAYDHLPRRRRGG